MTSSAISGASAGGGRFRPYHRADRNVFLAMVAIVWAGILVGFGWDILDRLHKHTADWPLIVHVHAAAFVSWLVLLTIQILLIRSRRLGLHKQLGLVGAALIPVMVVLGLAASWVVDRHYLGTKLADPSFLSIQLVDLFVFAPLATAALWLRGEASAHKRLILLATFQIADAGFGRWLGFLFPNVPNTEFWPNFLIGEAVTDLLVMALGAYDLITRGRLHPAYVAGAAWLLLIEVVGNGLYVAPAWKPIALHLLGH